MPPHPLHNSTLEIMEAYTQFVAEKARVCPVAHNAAFEGTVNGPLYKFQKAIVSWSLAQKKAAVFAATGLGKSFSLLSYAEAMLSISPENSVLIFTPLCTAKQLINEGQRMFPNLPISFVKEPPMQPKGKILVTNYEMATSFPDMASHFSAVILDESSILKHASCKTGTFIIENAQGVAYKLCLSATPCPNDLSEILHQAEFLGVATYDHLISTFFEKQSSSGNKVVLRSNAQKPFVEWLSSWSVWLDSPADLGFLEEAKLFDLPPLDMRYTPVDSVLPKDKDGKTLTHRMKARKATMDDRVTKAVDLVTTDPDQESQWVMWCSLNDESKALAKAIPGAVELLGTDSLTKKQKTLEAFADGRIRVLITKSQITGNWRNP